jgi:hypothetical protein
VIKRSSDLLKTVPAGSAAVVDVLGDDTQRGDRHLA